MSMVKTQVQLEKADLEALRRMAAEEGVSVSELVRRGVRGVLESGQKPTRRELMERAMSVFGKYHSGVPDLGRRHDHYLAEALEEEAKHWKSL